MTRQRGPVVAGDRNVFGDAKPIVPKHRQGSDRHQVVVGEDGTGHVVAVFLDQKSCKSLPVLKPWELGLWLDTNFFHTEVSGCRGESFVA
jgi:hypothetical protein